MKNSKGSALTGVILMVLVMTLIGVPLLGMVVYNYRLVELNNSLKRSEYENEMAMDIISRIIRETVIEAINDAKDGATAGVNELAELQRTNYSSTSGKYQSLWINEFNAWANGDNNPNADILGGFLIRIKSEAGSEDNETVRSWWQGLTVARQSTLKEESMDSYVSEMVVAELDSLESDELIESENSSVGILLDETGGIDEDALNSAYNMIFKARYQAYINNVIVNKILDATQYISIVSDVSNIDVRRSTELLTSENYLKIEEPIVRSGERIEIDTGTRFKKNKVTPPTTLAATFVINTPEFDSVSSVTQETITLSNALLNQGGVIVGGKLNLIEGTSLHIANDLTVLGEGKEIAIELEKGASLKALTPDGDVSNSRIATAKDIVLNSGTTFSTGANPIYYRNLYVGNAGDTNTDEVINAGDTNTDEVINVEFLGDAVAEDDLEIDYEETVNITQTRGANYYGFNDTNNKGPDSSSSIVINSEKLDNKTISLGNLYLAGRAFIEDVKGTENTPVYAEDGVTLVGYADTTYKTGESVAIKGNYIAYQTPLFAPDKLDYMFSPDKLKFSTYFLKRGESTEKNYATINLADKFVVKPSDFKGSFDVNYKWKYFMDYAESYASILRSVILTSNVRYVEGTAFDSFGKVKESSNETISDTSFRNNLATEYEKYTKYFGYRPVDEYGDVTGDAKTEIFGSNGWIKTPFSDSWDDEPNGNYYQFYSNENETLDLSGEDKNGIIVCKGDLTINVQSSAAFSGVIIVGGNLTIKGGTLKLKDGKEQVINTIINNYLGNNSDTTGTSSALFETFAYDGSGSSYIVTEIGDGLININELIGITNWKKSSYGRF